VKSIQTSTTTAALPRDEYGALYTSQVFSREQQLQLRDLLGKAVATGIVPKPLLNSTKIKIELTKVKIMDESQFKSLMLQAKMFNGEYGTGYQRGLRRHYHGEKFGKPEEHAALLQIQANECRKELGRGYRDGFAGKVPKPI